MFQQRLLYIASLCVLAGCSPTRQAVVKPDYPSARIWDSAVSEDRGRAAFFILSAVDGEPIEENAMRKSSRASFGHGRNIVPIPVERYVAAGKHRLTLSAQFAVAAPIEYLIRPSSFASVTGDVEVELKDGMDYRISGALEPLRREVWIEELESRVQIGKKVIHLEIADEARKAMAGAKFTCCNLHYNGDWISDTNETTLPMIPAGTPIVLTEYGSNRAYVLIDARKMRLGHDYGRKQESREQFVGKLIVSDDPRLKIRTFPIEIQDAVLAGKVRKGMTREQVIISLGYPRTDATPSLDNRQWTYWTASWDEYTVIWGDDGLVSDIAGPSGALHLVVAQ